MLLVFSVGLLSASRIQTAQENVRSKWTRQKEVWRPSHVAVTIIFITRHVTKTTICFDHTNLSGEVHKTSCSSGYTRMNMRLNLMVSYNAPGQDGDACSVLDIIVLIWLKNWRNKARLQVQKYRGHFARTKTKRVHQHQWSHEWQTVFTCQNISECHSECHSSLTVVSELWHSEYCDCTDNSGQQLFFALSLITDKSKRKSDWNNLAGSQSLYCVEWDVKLYYTIPPSLCPYYCEQFIVLLRY